MSNGNLFLFRYQQKCYANFTNIKKVKRVKKRYAAAIDEEEVSIIKSNAERPSLSSRHQNSEG